VGHPRQHASKARASNSQDSKQAERTAAVHRAGHDQTKASLVVANRAAAPERVVRRPAPRTAGAQEQQVAVRTASATAASRRALAVEAGPKGVAVTRSVALLEVAVQHEQAVRAAPRAWGAVAVRAAAVAAGEGGRP
jgi:hypothetical protein